MVLALRLFVTPLLIAAASLAGRRWGPGVSGWLIGLPLTSGPVSIILASQYGKDFAARAAVGTLGGVTSVCVFCLAYSRVSQRWGWPVSGVSAVLAFLVATLVWNSFSPTLLPTFAVLLIVIALTLRLIPPRAVTSNAVHLPPWDLPARMIIAAIFVVLLTAFAAVLGPQLSGLISPFPIFSLVLAAFAHSQQGANAASQLLRGVVIGLIGFAGFFLVVGGLLPTFSIAMTYILATLVALVVNGVTLRLAR